MSRIKTQILSKLKEYASKMGTNTMGGDDYTSKKKGGLRDNDGYDNVDYNRDMPQDESVNEAKDMTFSDYLRILDKKIEDAQKAVTGKNGSKEEILPSRGDILQNFKLFRNYISVLNKKYKGDKTKLRFISENTNKLAEACWKGYKQVGGKIKNGKQVPNCVPESISEGMFSVIDQIKKDSKDIRDFLKNVFKDREFKKMSNDKEFIKYLKSIYEGINEAIPQNFHQGRTSDYHTALRGKNRDYSGGTNFKKKNHGQPDVEEDDEDQETNHLSNQQLHVKAKLKVAESGKKKSEKNYKDWKNTNEGFDKVEHLSLLNKALRAIPGSNKQKDIIRQLNVIRKTGGMRPLKELSIVEYGQRLDLSFIEDEEAKLDGTYPSTDAIDRDIDESLKDMVGDAYTFVIGNGDEKKITPNTKEYVIEKIAETIKHNLYDWDFSLNGIDGSQAKEYSKIFDNDVLKPLLRNIDKTLKTYFKIDSKNKKISWKLSFRDNDKIIDAFFKKNKKISSDIRDSYFSQNEAVINEKQFKGLDGIDDKTPLTKISDTQKLKIIQSTGNIISFKVPKGSDRNFWQVISKGKIKKQKDLSNNVVYILPGKMIGSPKFKSIKDLIKGVDWVSVEKARRFNESVVSEDSPESAHPQGSDKLTNRTIVMDMLDVISHMKFGPDYHKLTTSQKKEVHKEAIKGYLINDKPFKESVNEAGVNVWYFYKKANKDKNKFFKMLSDFRKKHSDTVWIKMLNYALEDFNENPTKYKTIDDKQNILFKNLQTNKKAYE